MENLTESFVPFWKKIWQEYKVEILFLTISILCIICSIVTLLLNKQNENYYKENLSNQQLVERVDTEKIFVDIAGAVEKPDVFEISSGARLKDVLILAGGLSGVADRNFFAKNFNLARLLADQEKIYIPSKTEIGTGLTIENKDQKTEILSMENKNNSNLIDINSASIEDLDTLPGIGKVTAEKIIRGRPYSSVEALSTNKIISNNVYEKIKDLITVN